MPEPDTLARTHHVRPGVDRGAKRQIVALAPWSLPGGHLELSPFGSGCEVHPVSPLDDGLQGDGSIDDADA